MSSPKKINVDDIELALKLIEGDRTALEEILRVYGPAIARALSNKYQFSAEDCEDILSIAIQRLWQARDTYDENKGSLRTYFYRIVDNAACDVFKHGWYKARCMVVDYGKDNDLDSISSALPSHDQLTDESSDSDSSRRKKKEKLLRDLRDIVDSLPELQRHIIWSDACARDDVADSGKLADELGIAATSVRVYRGRAKETLRKKLRERGHKVP